MKGGKWLAAVCLASAAVLFALAGCAPGTSGGTEGPRELTFAENLCEEYVNWYGRCRIEDGAVCFNNSASGFEVRFSGTSLSAEIYSTTVVSAEYAGDPAVYVLVDGETDYTRAERIELDGYGSAETVALAEGLEAGEHTVRVLKCTQAKYGEARLLKLMADGGFLAPPAKATLKVELIGDSILSGCEAMVEEGLPDSGLLRNENSLASYGYIAASALGAQVSAVCRAGALVSGYNSLPSLPDYYDLVDEFSDELWDFSCYLPDIVIVDLGTNDLGNGAPEAFYAERYAQFLGHVRDLYPSALIVCCTGAMNSLCDEPVGQMVGRLQAAGDEKICHYTLPVQYAAGHPRERHHRENGEALAQYIASLLDLPNGQETKAE